MKLFIIFSTIFTISSAITIDCNFRTIFLTTKNGYGCDGTNTNDGSSQISTVNGNHLTGRSNNDTEVLRVWNDCTLELVPQKIGEFFPNLIALWFNDCKFKEIEADDFVELENLVELDLAYNQMEFVHEKTFEHLKSLQFLYLNNNRMIFVGPNVLQTLPSLIYVTFESNSCISSKSFNLDEAEMRNFIIDVAIQCPLTLKIAENILKAKKIEDSRNYIRDLREVMDNAMMGSDDDEEEDEIKFDNFEQSDENVEVFEEKINENLEDVVESREQGSHKEKRRNSGLKILSERNELQENEKSKVRQIISKKQAEQSEKNKENEDFKEKLQQLEASKSKLEKIIENIQQENFEMKKIIQEIKTKL